MSESEGVRSGRVVSFLLHAHLPYGWRADLAHSLEQAWLAEAVTNCYLPLLGALEELRPRAGRPWLTISLSPTLLELWARPEFPERYRRHLEEGLRVLAADAGDARHSVERRRCAGRMAEDWAACRARFDGMDGDLAGAFVRLARSGRVELATTAATHAFLPAFQNDPAFRAFQIGNGLAVFRLRTGLDPAGFWLPECGYFPGLEADLAAEGIRWFALEEHGLTAAEPPAGVRAPLRCGNGLLAVGRDAGLSRRVWSARAGYPGHPEYREFHRDGIHDLDADLCGGFALPDGGRLPLGLKYWRVTGAEEKDWYDPGAAGARVWRDAEDFADALAAAGPGLVFLPFDAELFGHWWHEGPQWLARVLDLSAALPETEVAGLSAALDAFPSPPQGRPGASSWGRCGDYSFWINPRTDWLYPQLRGAARAMGGLVHRFGGAVAKSPEGRALRQAARELLLASASDWPFMIRAGTTKDYALERLRGHLDRFSALRRMLEAGAVDPGELARIERLDPAFAEVRVAAFA